MASGRHTDLYTWRRAQRLDKLLAESARYNYALASTDALCQMVELSPRQVGLVA